MQACLQIPLTGAMLMVIFVFFDCIDIDEFSVLKVSDMVNKLVKGKGKAIEVDVGDKGKGIAIDDEIESLEDAEDEEQSSEKMKLLVMNKTLGVYANDEIEVDMDVMDPDEFESASDEDGLERIRNRKLKQLRKQGKTKDGSVPNTIFFIGKEFATADDVKKDIHKLSIETRRELFLEEK
ncbi:hypothetical protein Tco_0933530 [Tanacetum coccineum]